MERLPGLPLPLLQSVLGFAVPGYAEELPPDKRNGVTFVLKELQTVSWAWLTPLREVVEQYTEGTLILNFETASPQELQQMYQRVATRGKRVTELYVSMGTVNYGRFSYSRNFTIRSSLRDVVESVDIDWSRIFGTLKGLKMLNLAAMNFDSRHVIAVLKAAASYCVNLESLLLPYHDYIGEDNGTIQPVMNTMYGALKKWRVEGNCGGLRRLSVPTRNSKPTVKDNTEFFQNVMTNCPLVERLDGYKMSLHTSDRCTVKDAWLLKIEDWKRFNAVCTNLREFHWVVVPFGDPYFRVFGEHVKPQLKKLSFGVSMYWNWNWYFLDTTEAAGALPACDWEDEYCERPGYGSLAVNVSAALKGCPSLENLKVLLYHPLDPDIYPRPDENDVVYFREEEMLDQNVFGDHFCETVAACCPLLSRFIIKEVAEQYNAKNMKPIATFTDQGLMALAQLKYLQSLQLRSISCTGKGLLQFLNTLPDEFTGNRVYEIYVGGSSSESRMAFYEVVKELLMELAQTSEVACARHKFVLRLENWSYHSSFSVERDWSEKYLSELGPLMERVKAAHPSLRQHVVTMDRVGNTFMRMAEFGLFSMLTEPRMYRDWEEWESVGEPSDSITFADRDRMDEDDNGEGHSEFSDYYDYPDQMMEGNFYDDEYNEVESDIDDEYLDDDSDFEM